MRGQDKDWAKVQLTSGSVNHLKDTDTMSFTDTSDTTRFRVLAVLLKRPGRISFPKAPTAQ